MAIATGLRCSRISSACSPCTTSTGRFGNQRRSSPAAPSTRRISPTRWATMKPPMPSTPVTIAPCTQAIQPRSGLIVASTAKPAMVNSSLRDRFDGQVQRGAGAGLRPRHAAMHQQPDADNVAAELGHRQHRVHRLAKSSGCGTSARVRGRSEPTDSRQATAESQQRQEQQRGGERHGPARLQHLGADRLRTEIGDQRDDRKATESNRNQAKSHGTVRADIMGGGETTERGRCQRPVSTWPAYPAPSATAVW